MSEIEVVEVGASRRARQDFLAVPHRVFAGDPAWIAPLRFERSQHISPSHNPFFQHAEVQLFVAMSDGKPVGRISAQVDRLRLDRHKDQTGLFGFLDAIDDPAVFAALFGTAEKWLKARGMVRALGPFSFSINQETGLLTEGFQHPPAIMTGHARPYYADHVARCGYTPAKRMFAYSFDGKTPVPRALGAMLDKAKRDGDLTVRPIDKSRLDSELELLVDIFNDAWSENWGFVPFSKAEITKLGQDLKLLVKQDYIAFAEYRGEAAAMAVTLPDVNHAARDMQGRLWPFGWLKLLYRLGVKPSEAVRLPLMGLRRRHHGSPLGAAMAIGVIDAVYAAHRKRGFKRAELSWILEDNLPMRKMVEAMGGTHYKTYCVYEKALPESSRT